MSHDPRFIDRPYGCRSDADADMAREIRAEHTCTECGQDAAEASLCRECTEILHR